MRAMVIDAFGGPENLHLAEIPAPQAGAGEVLVGVACAGLNPVDWKVCEGRFAHDFPHAFPLVVGRDVAGTVDALGAGVTSFAPGDRVWGMGQGPRGAQAGSFAERVALPADQLAPMPAALDFASAASVPLAALTAWQALFDAAGLAAGQTVLVQAGAGGVGGFAVQLARHAGARVIATAGARNHDYVRGLGAETVIDYAREDFVGAVSRLVPGGVDVALSTVYGETHRRCYEAVRRGGFVVSITGGPDDDLAARHGVRQARITCAADGRELEAITSLFDAGALVAPAITVRPLAALPDAFRESIGGHVRGKIVIDVAGVTAA